MAWAICFLHGIGDSFRSDDWFEALTVSLESQGIDPPQLSSRAIIRPDYADLFSNPPRSTSGQPPDATTESASTEERQARRASYQRAQRAAIHDLPQTVSSAGLGGVGQKWSPEAGLGKVPGLRDFEHARTYLTDRHLRSAVLHRVLAGIGTRRDLLVIGHSLGSVVALDLLGHLPPTMRIRRVVTIGSPAGALATFRQHPEALVRRFPYAQVDGWVNILAPWDVVTRGLGVSDLFPAAVDVRIAGGKHGAASYLAHPATAKVIADPLRPKASVARATGAELEVRLTHAESDAVDAVLFAKLLLRQTRKADSWRRYALAVDAVREAAARELISNRQANRSPVPYAFDSLSKNRLDQLPFSRREGDRALMFAIVAATNNSVAPFELDTEKEQLRALQDLWHDEFGYTRAAATKLVDTIKEAKGAYGSASWPRYLLGGASLALLGVGPIGIALAAGSAALGAAALTSALAAFGPGGMVGGMALAGGLVGISSGTAVTALSASSMDRDSLQTQCVRLLAYARAGKNLDLGVDHLAPWRTLAMWRSQLAMDLSTVTAISDDDAPSVKGLKARLKIVDKAINWLVDRDLAPLLPVHPE